jgi:hypothetical protein
MCVHTKALNLKRNAVVSVRKGLNVVGLGPINQELSRQENFYDWMIDQWQEHCPVCYDIVYQPPECWDEVEARWEWRICQDIAVWRKKVPNHTVVDKYSVNPFA